MADTVSHHHVNQCSELKRLTERVAELEEEVVDLKCVPWRSCEEDCDHRDFRNELRYEMDGNLRRLGDALDCEGRHWDWCNSDPGEGRIMVDYYVSKQKEKDEEKDKVVEKTQEQINILEQEKNILEQEKNELRRDLSRETSPLKYLHKSLEDLDDIKCLDGVCKGETYQEAKKCIMKEHGRQYWREWRKRVTWGIID